MYILVIRWDPNTNNQILAYIRVWALSFAQRVGKWRGGHTWWALVAGEVADEDLAKGKGSTKVRAPGAGMRQSLPSRRRQQERRRERERAPSPRDEAGGDDWWDTAKWEGDANSGDKSASGWGGWRWTALAAALLLTGKAVRCVGTNLFFGFGFWAKIQTLPREFTTPFSFCFARNVPEYKKALAGDGD